MSLVALLVFALSIVVATSVGVRCLLFVRLKVPVVVVGFERSADGELDDDEEPFSSLLAATSGSNRTLLWSLC